VTRRTVIGASGFVGGRLLERLQAAGVETFAPRRGDEAALFSQDLGQVYYCAGLTADYLARPFDTVEAHVTLVARLLKEAKFDHLVYLSSTRLYDSLGAKGGREEDVLALSPAEPRHLYDLSKGLGENLCLTQSGGRAAVARLSCVFDWSARATGFLPEWLRRAERERTIELDSSTGYVRDYIHLDDTVEALCAISDRQARGIFNVASGENVTNGELAEVFARHGWTVRLARETSKQAAPLCSVEAIAGLGVRPRRVRDVVEARLKEIGHGPG
jgi:nucleoside-diphosphate-sugar epimerase